MNVAAAKRSSKMDSGGGSPDSIASASPQQLLVSPTSAQQPQQPPLPPRGGRIRTASSANSLITTSSGGLSGSIMGFDRNNSNGTIPTITFPSSGVLSPSQSMNSYPLWEELDEDILGSDILGFTTSNSSAAPEIGLQHHHPLQQGWPSSPGMSSISPLAPPPTMNSIGPPLTGTNNTAQSSQQHWPTFRVAPREEHTTTTTTTASQQQPIISEEEIHEFIAMYTNCSSITSDAPPSTPAVQFYPSSTTTKDFSSTTNTDKPQQKPILCTYHNFPKKPSTDSNEQRFAAAANTTQSSTASASYNNSNNNYHQRQASSSFLQQMQSLLNPDLGQQMQPNLESNNNVSMLPPPPRLPGSNETPSPENNVQVDSQQKHSKGVDVQHLVWIRELNQRAKRIWEQHNGGQANTITTPQPPKVSSTTYTAPSFSATFPVPVHPFYRTQPTVPPASTTTAGAGTASSSSQGSTTSTTNEVVYDWHSSQQQEQQQPKQQPQPIVTAATTPGSESDERRARRLMRNRESARQSRRRKKETLLFLGKKVQKLHDALEEKRASKIVEMEQQLLQLKTNSSSATIAEIVDMYKEHAKLRKQVSLFQYNTMKDTLLPQYHQFLLWISNQCKENFYTAAKESRPKSSSKMSSKQIGEEIATIERQEPNHSGKYLECSTEDVQRFWPLFCYEFSFSVEQEEKFKSRYMEHRAKVQEEPQNDESSVHRLASAFALVSKLAEKGTLHNNYNAVALRRDRILLKVLTEEQSEAFLKWMEENKEQCSGLYHEKSHQSKQEQQQLLSLAALDQLCDQLEKTLNIHYNNNDQDEMSD